MPVDELPVRASRPWVKAALVLVLLAGLALRAQDVLPVLRHAGERDNPRPGLRDFRDTMYEAGHDLRDGENPYDPEPYLARHPGHQELDLYAPQLFVFAVPTSFVPLALAQSLWFLVLAASVGLLAWLAWRLARRRPDVWVVAGTAGALFASGPVQQGIETGNISLPLAAAAAGAVHIGARRPVAAGLLVAAVLIKPQLGLPLVLLLGLGLRWWRVVAVALAAAAATALVPAAVALHAAGSISNFVDSLSRNLDYSTKFAGDIAHRAETRRSDLWGFIGKVFKVNPTTATQFLTLFVLCGLAVLVLQRTGASRRNRLFAVELAVLVTALLLAMPHYSYDLPLLIVPVVAIGLRIAVRRVARLSFTAAVAFFCVLPLLHLGSVDTALDKIGLRSAVPWIDPAAIGVAFALAAAAGLATSRPDRAPTPS